MENILNITTMDIVIRLLVALLLGMIIGVERVWAHKTAGMRTYALVAMGAALFIIISEMISVRYLGIGGFDPTRMASQIIVGIGFIGTGLIFAKETKLMGLTTATGLWVSAGIGMAAGFKLFDIAIIATILTLFIFIVLWFVEEQLKKTKYFRGKDIQDLS
ncbi:MAG: MgtC/SapB family protein [Candidatus Paceibacterota bacterium]|jgi:putative Mg2+ transporter-C (MgtC) family protein